MDTIGNTKKTKPRTVPAIFGYDITEAVENQYVSFQ